jgi:hypothetical protein
VFYARPVPMAAHATVEYVMPPLNNIRTTTEERCFISGPCRDVISRTVNEELVSQWSGVSRFVSDQVSELEDCWGSVVVSCCCEKLVDEAGDSSGTQRKRTIRRWKPLPSNGW